MDANKMALKAISGNCLCEAVTITLNETKPLIDICHCAMCRRWCGGPFMGVDVESFELTGADLVTSFASSDWAERAFCSRCGSNLWYRFLPSDHYSFSAGLFDMGDDAQIEQQIFVDEKPGFYDFAQETPMKTGKQIIAETVAPGHSFEET